MVTVSQAVQQIELGNSDIARAMLIQILQRDSKKADAWYYLSILVDDIAPKRAFLRKALAIEPDHVAAWKYLKEVGRNLVLNSGVKEEYSSQVGRSSIDSPEYTTQKNEQTVNPLEDFNWARLAGLEDDLSPISLLHLSPRSFIALMRSNVTTVGKLAELGPVGVSEVQNIGKDSVQDIYNSLLAYLKKVSPVQIELIEVNYSKKEEYIHEDFDWNSTMVLENDISSISALNLSVRSFNILLRGNVLTVGELIHLGREGVSSVRYIDDEGLREIEDSLAAYLDKYVANPVEPIDPFDFEGADIPREFHVWTPLWDLKNDQTPILALDLSTRSFHALMRSYIDTVGQLVSLGPVGVSRIWSIGDTSLQEITASLLAYLPRDLSFTDSKQKPSHAQELNLKQVLDQPVSQLGLPRRIHHALSRSGYRTIRSLVGLSDEELLNIRQIGETSIPIIRDCLVKIMGLPIQSDDLLAETEGYTNHVLQPTTLRAEEWNPRFLTQVEGAPLEQIAITKVAFPTDLEAQLELQGIGSIQSLITYHWHNYKDSEIGQRLEAYLLWLASQDESTWHQECLSEQPNYSYLKSIAAASLDFAIEQWFSCLDQRERECIELRYGFYDQQNTLQNLANQYGLSRERIRQIQKFSINKLARPTTFRLMHPYPALVRALIADTGGLISAVEFEERFYDSLQMDFSTDIDPTSLTVLISDIDDDLEFLNNHFVLAAVSKPDLLSIGSEAKIILRKALMPLSGPELLSRLRQAGLQTHSWSDQFVFACVKYDPAIEELDTGSFALVKWRKMIIDEMYQVLRSLGFPSHYSLIATQANKLLPKDNQISDRKVHAHLGRYNKIFIRVGHGIFGLAEWGLHDDGNLANAAFRVLSSIGKPTHIDTIATEVLKTWHVNPSSVNMAIQNDERFLSLSSGIVYLRDSYTCIDSEDSKEEVLSFGDLYGSRLGERMSEIQPKESFKKDRRTYDPHNEAEKIRKLGLDFLD